MEIVDKPEVVLLDNLNPTSLSSHFNRTMRTATTGFESSLHPQLIDATGTTLDPALSQEHRAKTRLQKLIRVPPTVAQTHTRMTPINLGIGRVDRKRLNSLTIASVTPTTVSSKSSSFLLTSEVEPNSISSSLSFAADSNTSSDPKLKDNLVNNHNSNDDKNNRGSQPMVPRDGFTFANSLFEKVRFRVWQQSIAQQKPQPTTKSHPAEESGSSQEDGIASKGSNRDSTEVESNASNSCPNTLSAGTAGNINSNGHLDVLHHLHTANPHDPSNDSDGTVTDLEDLNATRLRQRKNSFSSCHSSTGLDVIDVNTTPRPSPTAADALHTEVITELAAEDALSHLLADNEQDPVDLFEEILTRQHMTEDAIAASLHELRQLILAYGIPEQSTANPKAPSIRGKCWKLLLEVHHVSAQEYVSLVKRGKPQEYGKIRNDTFRTMATDRKFTDVVEEDSLIRVLCAFAWSTQATTAQDTGVSFTYVQGMNVLAAPFLYTMSEMEAFYSYSNLIKHCCPLYVQPTLQGVHCGIKLLEECLCKIDGELYDSLKSKNLTAKVYAFPSVLTLCACTPPLEQAMQLWDFLLAWGIHLNIICIIAQLHMIRDELMSHA
ncbi:hypothetical protein BGZ79_003756, partial [Entomortierella chlamydospora]